MGDDVDEAVDAAMRRCLADEAWAPWLEANTAPDSLRAELHRQAQRRQACVMPFAEAC